MKIEPRYNRKKPAYMAAATLIAASALVTGCGPSIVGGIQTQDYHEVFPNEEYVVSAGKTCTSGTQMYQEFKYKVMDIERSAPGQYTYSVTSVYNEAADGYFYVLTAWNGQEPTSLVYDSSWAWFKDDGTCGIDIDNSISYDEFMDLPFLMDTRYLFHYELGEEGVASDIPTEYVRMIDNGVYSGRLVAVSEDGKSGLFCISPAITFDRRMVRFLSSGDPIGVYDLTIGEEIYSPEGDLTAITLESSCFNDLCLTPSPGDSDVLCLTGSDGILLGEPVLIEMSFMSSCDVREDYDELYEGDGFEDTGYAFLDSYFWHYISEGNASWNDGWIIVDAPVDSVYVRGNTVFEIDIDHEDIT